MAEGVEGVEEAEASGDGGSGGIGAVSPAGGAAVAEDSAAADELLESHSAAYVWSGLLQARPVSSIQPRVDERRTEKRQLVRCAGQTWRPVGPDSA